jgi:[ribosomal protein S5]-alanine N-acetyltransferase
MRSVAAQSLTLEPQAAAHAPEMFAVLSDPAIYEYENAPPASLEWLRARFEKLESRRSADGREQWLNWVIRLPGTGLVGYVQATVRADGSAGIAYELASAHWGKGLGRQAVSAMMRELAAYHHATSFTAVAKRANLRSTRLLERLGFVSGGEEMRSRLGVEEDEVLMVRAVARPRVVDSLLNPSADHCVDVFVRDDGTFGFEEYRSDPEDGRGWFALNRFADLVFAAQADALADARARVAWLAPEPAFEIRRAVHADGEALEALYRDCRRDARWLPAWRSDAAFAEVSADEAVFVAVGSKGELYGLVSVWEEDPFVHHLYVREAVRRSGVAGALLESLVGVLPFPWRLKCMIANNEALEYYLKRGWKRIGEGEGSEGEYVELRLDHANISS